MRGKIAWLKSPVRHRTLAPFDGITRIRFKGSSNWTSQPLRLPRSVEFRIRPTFAKSTHRPKLRGVRQIIGGTRYPKRVTRPLLSAWGQADPPSIATVTRQLKRSERP